jgi:hypothetical protein
VKMVFTSNIFTLNETNTCVAHRTPDSVRCAHFPSVLTTITITTVTILLKPLNKRELFTTYQNHYSVARTLSYFASNAENFLLVI